LEARVCSLWDNFAQTIELPIGLDHKMETSRREGEGETERERDMNVGASFVWRSRM